MATCGSCRSENRPGAKFCDTCGAALAVEPEREERKTVSVIFCDVTGSTALGESVDAEALRLLLASYFVRMKAIVESHGGTVEKFVGDAVMAVFGVPVVHEDDAIRAVRAAGEMRDALPELGVQGRIGVSTGEVVTGTEERLATGDAVNIAARLEQAAAPGEVLLAAETFRLVHGAAQVESLEPVVLKGKTKGVAAYRLVALREVPTRRNEAPLVGRNQELDLLRRSFLRVVRERACHLFTLLGAAGVGKSRLVEELLRDLDGARVVRGRCLSYGEGITYFPVVEVLKQLNAVPPDAVAAVAIGSLLGERGALTSPQETAWAFRRLIETSAQTRPLVVVFDDLHWGEPTFLDLVEHVADLSRDAPILLLCVARPELLEKRPGWGGGKLNATTSLLEPLGPAETDLLIEKLLAGAKLDSELRSRIRSAAEGNPLFVEEMVAMARETGDGEVVVPPTIHALLAARLDQLPRPERAMLELGAVEGKEFHRGAIVALAPAGTDPDPHLMMLVRKDLIRPAPPQLAGEEAYRFRHLLIRDAAYEALPKAVRARYHEQFAIWLADRGAHLVANDEIAGYHLEQAFHYKTELGQRDVDLGHRASALLTAAGWRARERGDVAAEENLFERALALRSGEEIDEAVELELIEVYSARGRYPERDAMIDRLARRAASRGDRITQLRALLGGELRLSGKPFSKIEAIRDEALEVMTAARHDAGLTQVWRVSGYLEFDRCHFLRAIDAFKQARDHALASGDRQHAISSLAMMLNAHLLGPTPVAEALAFLEAHPELDHFAGAIRRHGELEAMLGHFDHARALVAEAHRIGEERGLRVNVAGGSMGRIDVEQLAGDPEAAVREGIQGFRDLEAIGSHGYASTVAALLAWAYLDLNLPGEAERWARTSDELGGREDIINQLIWRSASAIALARQGHLEEAEKLAGEAIEWADDTDALRYRAEARMALGEVLTLAGRSDDARTAFGVAIRLFDEKGATVLAARARRALTAVRTSD